MSLDIARAIESFTEFIILAFYDMIRWEVVLCSGQVSMVGGESWAQLRHGLFIQIADSPFQFRDELLVKVGLWVLMIGDDPDGHFLILMV